MDTSYYSTNKLINKYNNMLPFDSLICFLDSSVSYKTQYGTNMQILKVILVKDGKVVFNDKSYTAADKFCAKVNAKAKYIKLMVKNQLKKLDNGIMYYPHKIDACSEKDIKINNLESVKLQGAQADVFGTVEYEDFQDI
jgi:hypothetical protein